MKTIQIQQQITALKGMVREWGTTQSVEDWTTLCQGLNDLVEVTYRTLPPKIEIKEVEVIREVPVQVPVEVTKEVPMTHEVAKAVEVIVYVPVFEPEK